MSIMRTDRLWTRALPLASLLLVASAAGLAAQRSVPALPRLAIATLLQGGDGDVITGDHTVKAGEKVDDIVVIGGNLTVEGNVTGDAVVVGGNLLLESGGAVDGDAVVTGGKIVDHGGRVRGEMRVVDGAAGDLSRRAAESATAAARSAAGERAEAARSAAMAAAMEQAHSRRDHSWFTPIRRGFEGLLSTVALGLVLAGIGSALIFYGRPYLETVSDTIRSSTVRSGAVGVAAGFLVAPAFVVLLVALAVSIIGIPLLLLSPLYWVAFFVACAMGILAAAHAIGERTAEQRRETFSLRYRNSYSYLFTGVGILFAPLVVGSLLRIAGLGFFGGAFIWVGGVILVCTAVVGFGAVILSRAGTRRSFVAPVMDPVYDPDPLFDEPSSPGSRV
jgi:hypothetical protein